MTDKDDRKGAAEASAEKQMGLALDTLVVSPPRNVHDVEMSGRLDKIAPALARAQGRISHAPKDSKNPFFHSTYADLPTVWNAFRSIFADEGLSVVQVPVSTEKASVSLTSILLHESGQYIAGRLTMYPKDNTPQGAGSCITYMRRYMAQGLTSVCPDDDDDGNAASGGSKKAPLTPTSESLAPNQDTEGVILSVTQAVKDGPYTIKMAFADGEMVFQQSLLPVTPQTLYALTKSKQQVLFQYRKKGQNLELIQLRPQEPQAAPQEDAQEMDGQWYSGYLKAYGSKKTKNGGVVHTFQFQAEDGQKVSANCFSLSDLGSSHDFKWTPEILERVAADMTPLVWVTEPDGQYKRLVFLDMEELAGEEISFEEPPS